MTNRIAVNLPPELHEGAYSDVVMVWHNQYGFTLDFCSQISPEPIPVDEGDEAIPLRVVSRIRIPPSVIFLLMKALNENLTNYENKFGAIPQPDEQDEGGES